MARMVLKVTLGEKGQEKEQEEDPLLNERSFAESIQLESLSFRSTWLHPPSQDPILMTS